MDGGEPRLEGSAARTYATEGIEVGWEPSLCLHGGHCFLKLPSVFDPKARPWVRLEGADPDEVAQTVMRCPTGALTFRRLDDGPQETDLVDAETVRVRPRRDGPLELRGRVRITGPGGGREMTRVTLCRCGASGNKPFCDNSHLRIGFRDLE